MTNMAQPLCQTRSGDTTPGTLRVQYAAVTRYALSVVDQVPSTAYQSPQRSQCGATNYSLPIASLVEAALQTSKRNAYLPAPSHQITILKNEVLQGAIDWNGQ